MNMNHKGLKPPGAMRDRISFREDFDLPIDDLFDGDLDQHQQPGPECHEEPAEQASCPRITKGLRP